MVFDGYCGFLHLLQLSLNDLAEMAEKETKNEIPDPNLKRVDDWIRSESPLNRFTHVRRFEVLSMVLSQLKGPFGLFVKRSHFVLSSGFLSRRYMASSVKCCVLVRFVWCVISRCFFAVISSQNKTKQPLFVCKCENGVNACLIQV